MRKLACVPDVRDHNSSFRDEVTLVNIIFCGRMRHTCKWKISHFFSAPTVSALTRRCHRPPSKFGLLCVQRHIWVLFISALTEEPLWQEQRHMGDPWGRRTRAIFLEGPDQAPPAPSTVLLGNKASQQRSCVQLSLLCLQQLQTGFRQVPGG